jgi:succinate dehydrogenase / fumarate reductase cytochrome b subunit
MFLNSSIARKQTVAITGTLLVLFIILHLCGNLLFYAGPAVFNAYAHHLHSLGPLLWVARLGLLAVFLIHISLTSVLVVENIKARGGHKRYAVESSCDDRSLAEKIMPYSGLYILIFLIYHIRDFAFADPLGPSSLINNHSYGIYGIVFNAFRDPVHDLLYIFFLCFLGLHLCHGLQSISQTYGFPPKWVAGIKLWGNYVALLLVIAFSSIPVYVHLLSH